MIDTTSMIGIGMVSLVILFFFILAISGKSKKDEKKDNKQHGMFRKIKEREGIFEENNTQISELSIKEYKEKLGEKRRL